MENMLDEFENEEIVISEKYVKIEKRKQEINQKLKNLSEEELIKNMIASIEDSVSFAKKNDIETIECED